MTKAPRALNIAAITLIGTFCLQALLAVPRLSATSDEPIHLAAGYSYWQTRDFRMNPEHPPLAKLFAALPLLALHPRFDTSEQNWKAAVQDAFAFEFLYGNDADRLLFWSRAVMVLIAALGAAMTVKFSGALLPIVLAGFCLVRKQIKSLFIMAAACLLVIEAAYLFSSSPLLYFRNMGFVNANHLKNYPFYLFGELKPGGW